MRFPHLPLLWRQRDDYDYLFYREILTNSDELTSENVTGNDTLRFRGPIQVYTRQTTPTPVPTLALVPSPA